jgi:hypothetical protein
VNRLAAQQRALAAAIVHDQPADNLLRPRQGGQAARLFVYQEAYRVRLAAALESNYPILRCVLGDDAFRDLAGAYAREHPSRQPSIRWFGHDMAAFLRTQPGLCRHPSLADLAAMEWGLRNAFDAADATPSRVDDLVRLRSEQWPVLRFSAHPSVTLLPLEWAVEPLWKALTADENANTDPPPEHAHVLLVWRVGLDTRWRSLDSDEAPLLEACVAGKPFAELGALAELYCNDTPAARLAGLLRLWIEAGVLLMHAA